MKSNIEKGLNKKAIIDAILEANKIINNDKIDRSTSADTLKMFLEIIFFVMEVILWFLSIGFIIFLETNFWTTSFFNISSFSNIISTIFLLLFTFLISIIFIVVAILLRKTRKELKIEKDRNYIATFFSAITSLIALVISLIALLTKST